jgi:type II secretion system protein G
MKLHSRGFTIVELLIVIIVVGILASITVVSYNGSQARAEYARAQSDMKNIHDALIVYKAQNGSYPESDGGYDVPADTILKEELVPNYLDDASILTAKTGYTYVYSGEPDGSEYHLVRIAGTIGSDKNLTTACQPLPTVESSDNPLLKVPQAPNTSLDAYEPCNGKMWGYWSPNAANW